MDYNADVLIKIIKLGRPQFTFGILMYFLIGTLFALLSNANFDLNKFIWGYLILFMASMATHYSNDYFDFEVDQYGTRTPFSGGSGILVENPELKDLSKKLAYFFIILSLIIAALFTVYYSFPLSFFLFVLFGNALVWFYSAPPIKLSYRGVGEFGNLLNGFIMPGAGYFVTMGTIDLPFIIFSTPFLFLQFMFTIGVEIPDMEGDELGGKITWIVSKGREFGFKLMGISVILATVSFLVIPLTNLFPPIIDFRILTLISLIPLSLGLFALWKRPVDKITATKLATYNVGSLFAVWILVNCYFIYLLK
ncbi:prenyltransferase [Methanobacterium alcaliphilum]|uniref:prenyltransferase n=1 Tax=Methanobacterium alcaliphilum TaxID=392018 RepID=UPI00200AB148|nr:prenyltransferase [Methanobacterium alcaliphilum]MCK9151432.1 prenyltransferase [Methanobacterium alcaliphilum]